MKTYLEVDGEFYPGTMHLGEMAIHPGSGRHARYNYLSADLGDEKYLRVEKWDFDQERTPESDLRAALTSAIRFRKQEHDCSIH